MVLGKGNCKCLSGSERDLMLNSLKRSMREESNTIDDIRTSAEDLKKAGWTIDELISAHLKILADFEKLRSDVKNTPVCELMLK